MAPPKINVPFNLRRRFALTSLAVITVIAIGLGWLMSHVLTQRMLQREGEVTMDFVQNLLRTDASGAYLSKPDNAELKALFLASMAHVASMREPVRANAYRRDGTVVWSTDMSLVGRKYPDNDELEEALRGELVVHSGKLVDGAMDKGEHVGLSALTDFYVESYIPILDANNQQVLGVMELYKVPLQLNAAIRMALLQLWGASAASALLLFGALYWTVARADHVMRDQQALLAESQTLANAVELARAVAHNLRNPLASIRVSAEMLQSQEDAAPEQVEHCGDITACVDRADRWITELVRVTQAPQLQSEELLPSPLLRACLQEMEPEMNRRGIAWSLPADDAPAILAHTAMLRQIVVSILANAIDVMPQGGQLDVRWQVAGAKLLLQIVDNGPGIQDAARHALFRPFFSTKSGGLGIGLALVKRMVEQWGGQVSLNPAPTRGTVVELTLPLARAGASDKA